MPTVRRTAKTFPAEPLMVEACPACVWEWRYCYGCLNRRQVLVIAELGPIPGAFGRWRRAVRDFAALGRTLPAAQLLPDGQVAYGVAGGTQICWMTGPQRRRACMRATIRAA